MPGWLIIIIIICGVCRFGVSGGGGLAFLIAVCQGTVTRHAGPWVPCRARSGELRISVANGFVAPLPYG